MIRQDDGKPERAYSVGKYIANLLSGVFVPLPVTQAKPDSEMMQEISNVLRETGDAIVALISLRDWIISRQKKA